MHYPRFPFLEYFTHYHWSSIFKETEPGGPWRGSKVEVWLGLNNSAIKKVTPTFIWLKTQSMHVERIQLSHDEDIWWNMIKLGVNVCVCGGFGGWFAMEGLKGNH